MKKKVTEFIKSQDGENIIVNSEYAEAYIPYDVIGKATEGHPVFCEFGSGYRGIGLFNMRFFDNDENVDREGSKLRVFKYPNVIDTFPSDTEVAILKLDKDMDEDKYLILKYFKGDIMMSQKIQQSSHNCESFMNQLIKGKLPKGLSYLDLYFAWEKNFDINGVDPGVSDVIIQFILSENAREKGNPSKHFRKLINEEGISMFDYKIYNMVEICASNSVMNALIFERFSDMLVSSLNKSKEGVEQITTPLEEILRM